MSDVAEKDKKNPAGGLPLPKNFQPMNSATLRLEVPVREGYHRHWFRGNPERIAKAQLAGYTFVNRADVHINNFDLAGDSLKQEGSSDLGSRASVISGDDLDVTGQPGRLYLMECPNEWYEVGQKILQERNDSIAEALRGGKIGSENESSVDSDSRYVPKGVKIPDLFNPNKRRRM